MNERKALVILAMACIAGCSTAIRESRLLQAADPAGRVGYYRVDVQGSAKLAQASYRSGLYDSDALDALFGAVSQSGDDVHDVLARRRREAVDRLAADYFQTIEKSTEPGEVDAAEGRLARALRSPYSIASDKDSAGRALDRRKYALIFSAKASEIEQAIASLAEEKETTDSLMTAIASQRRSDYLRVQGDAARLGSALTRLEAIRTQAAALASPSAAAPKPEKDRFTARVVELMDALAGVEVP